MAGLLAGNQTLSGLHVLLPHLLDKKGIALLLVTYNAKPLALIEPCFAATICKKIAHKEQVVGLLVKGSQV